MSEALKNLIEVLRPTELGENAYRGKGSSGDGDNGSYGGHFLGQATAAALATVDHDQNVHSIHAYFIRGGLPGQPIDYTIARLRDGRSFSTRRVTASQDGKIAFELIASFTVAAAGEVIEPEMPKDFDDLPSPESLPLYHELMATHDPVPFSEAWALREHGVDVRVVNAPWSPNGSSPERGIRMWIRANGKVPDDPKLHSAMLAYQSDESIADNLLIPFGVTWSSPGIFFVSLDHAMWFHRPIDMNEWHFVEQRCLTAEGARGVACGYVWTQDKKLVASFTQEVLMRLE